MQIIPSRHYQEETLQLDLLSLDFPPGTILQVYTQRRYRFRPIPREGLGLDQYLENGLFRPIGLRLNPKNGSFRSSLSERYRFISTTLQVQKWVGMIYKFRSKPRESIVLKTQLFRPIPRKVIGLKQNSLDPYFYRFSNITLQFYTQRRIGLKTQPFRSTISRKGQIQQHNL